MDSNDDSTEKASVPALVSCRADSVGISGFAECRCAGPNMCVYALPFGYAFLCRHPRLNEILENTRKERAGAASTQ
jgi:hypothetical protein